MKKFLENIYHLANLIENDTSEDQFYEVAYKHLNQIQFNNIPKDDDLLNFIHSDDLPSQSYKLSSFSNFSLTLYHTQRFNIDLYIWKQRDTSIHNHNFEGAFKVLYGDFQHSKYTFQPSEIIDPLLTLGNLKLENTEVFSQGKTVKIKEFDKFIHQVIHLSDFSMTLCVRTIGNHRPLSRFIAPHIKLLNTSTSIKYRKTLDLIQISSKDKEQILDLSNIKTGLLFMSLLEFENKDESMELIKLILNELKKRKMEEVYLKCKEFSFKEYKTILKMGLIKLKTLNN